MPGKLPISEIILASISPRRKMLLEQVGIPFVVIPPIAEEAHPTNGDFGQVAMRNAEAKARSLIAVSEGRVILGADTLVELDGVALGKPKDPEDAERMLKLLSGREHRVYTGIALVDPASGMAFVDWVVTRVWFRDLGEMEIKNYIASGEPLDKAGAYGIQERGALLIERIDGCFFNVMGLPLSRLWDMLKDWMSLKGKPLAGW